MDDAAVIEVGQVWHELVPRFDSSARCYVYAPGRRSVVITHVDHDDERVTHRTVTTAAGRPPARRSESSTPLAWFEAKYKQPTDEERERWLSNDQDNSAAAASAPPSHDKTNVVPLSRNRSPRQPNDAR